VEICFGTDSCFLVDANDRLSIDSYDNNGNTTSSGTNTYDFENRMTAHGSVQIVYDGDGNRVSETAGGVTTKYLWTR
jgi:YD repeat-containing protein